jgi:hypothetical protein
MRKYIERGRTAASDPDVFEQIPRLINGAERQLIQVLKLQGTIEVMNDPSGFTPGTSVVPKPDRWRETVSMSYGKGVGKNERVTMFPRSYEYCRSYWPNDATQDAAQLPLYYADMNLKNWLIVPTAPTVLPVEIVCYMQPPLLSETNETNFWTDYTPNALLYCALKMSAPFIKNDERIQVWDNLYQFEISTLAGQDLQKIMDRSSERSRP